MTMQPVTIAVVCGTGAIGAQVAKEKLRQAAAARKLPVNLVTCLNIQLKSLLASGNVDMIVSTTAITTDYGIPYFLALPFLTGIGEKELLKEILDTAERVMKSQS